MPGIREGVNLFWASTLTFNQKKMKKIFIYILAALIICSASCKKFLATPQQSQLFLSDFWKSSQDAELGVAAIYNTAQIAFEEEYWAWGEVRADNFINNERPSPDNQQLITNQLTSATAGADWSSLYTAIATANTAIKNIPAIPDFARKNNLLAEALTLRALFYFYAVRVWGDVPKITEPVEGIGQALNISRSPVIEIYKDIILADLEGAEKLMTTAKSLNNISLSSILALKAHVYMWPGSHQNYTTARDAITKLEGYSFSLETTPAGWVNIFRGTEKSNEIIFALAWNFNEDGGNSGIARFSPATPHIVPSEALEQKWRAAIPGDFRIFETAAFDIEIVPNVEFPYTRILTKYSPRFSDRNVQGSWGTNNDRDIIFYRLSGILLLKAEAENYLNNPSGALALVNRIRAARGLALVANTITDKTAIRDLILNERQFELMGEGHRYWDLVRNNVVLEVMRPINGMNDPRRIIWPISQNVLNRNAAIKQNDGY